MDYLESYNNWLNSSSFDEHTKASLAELKGNNKEIYDRFNKDLEFGTGGLRALLGVGRNRLNRYTVGRITKGYGNFLIKKFGTIAQQRGVVIAYDMRYCSKEFSLEVAKVLTSMDIKVFLFNKITCTPELSFSIPYFNAIGGIVLTASHNPPEYNGYKIYDNLGCQVVPTMANEIINEINLISDYSLQLSTKKSQDMINLLDDSVDKVFLENRIGILKNKEIIYKVKDKLSLLYTPLHGTGREPIMNGLKKIGFNKIYTVEEQLIEDPEFSTLVSPNPEDISAFSLAIDVAKKNNVDLILASDPDGDRIGVVVKNAENNYTALTGNQIGALMIEYVLSTNKEMRYQNDLYIANTIVTGPLGGIIAKSYGVHIITTLTGFKFIGEQIDKLPANSNFILGYEESNGFLIGDGLRDKDAVGSALLISEMAAFYYSENLTLLEQLEKIYLKYGFFGEDLISHTLTGVNGEKKILKLMDYYRNLNKDYLTNNKISHIVDYEEGINDLPKSNVLKIYFTNGSWIAVRPSGTEPKIKFYLNAKGDSSKEVDSELKCLRKFINDTFYSA